MITLDLTPTEEAQIFTVAQQTGLAPAEYIKKLVQEHLPPTDSETASTIAEENTRAIAVLQSWIEQERTEDPEELREAEEDLNELLHNLNRNRIESGESRLFP